MLLLLFANLSLIEQLRHQLTVKHQNVEFCFIYFYSLMNTFHGLLPRWMCAKKCNRLPILVQLHHDVLSVFKTMALILGVSLQYSQQTVAASTDTGKQNRVSLQCHTVETSQCCLRSKENKDLFQAAVIWFPRDITSTKYPASLCRETNSLWDHRTTAVTTTPCPV